MDKSIKNDVDFVEMMEKYKQEAAKNAVNAFNEGYLLGAQHAKEVYGIEKGEKWWKK